MTGYTLLTEDEIAFLIHVFDTTEFSQLDWRGNSTQAKLLALKDDYLRGCLTALITKYPDHKEEHEIINEILEKNGMPS